MEEYTDEITISGKEPLTEEERKLIRRMMIDYSRANWARKKIMIAAPWLVGFVSGTWFLVDWVIKHITFNHIK